MQTDLSGASQSVRATRVFIICVLLALVTACGKSGGEGAGQGKPQQQSIPVQVRNVQPHQVDVSAEYPGRVQGKRTVQVVGRVTGILLKKDYTEGSIVKKGQLLFKIDPKPFQATVDQRKATLASARAKLANSTRIWHRTKRLYDANAVSEAERDQALANYQSDKAAVQQASADLESAQIDLGYTQVNAPLTGVTSLREVDEGSLVTANQTKLTSITQLDPVYVLFALPEDDAFARRKALADMGEKSTDKATREATIIQSDGSDFPYKGKVDFTQSTIDPDTGTVQLRAIVKNPKNALMPGAYVRVRLRIQTLDKAITVPAQAISDDGQQTLVFVVKDGKAKSVEVELGPETNDGTLIKSGLSQGDQVITTGLGAVKPGAPVKVAPDKAGKPSKKDGASGQKTDGSASSDADSDADKASSH